jgi:hypothetical protein
MFRSSNFQPILLLGLFLILAFGCAKKEEVRPLTGNPKLDKLKLPDGFVAELLYSPGEN